MKTLKILTIILTLSAFSCNNKTIQTYSKTTTWQESLNTQLSLFGHRNWILIVDKAFPMQNANGITTIDTNEDLLPVLKTVLQQIDQSTHVRPIVYTDKELSFVTEDQVSGIESYRKLLDEIVGKMGPQVLLHDSVFVKIDQASKLFGVLVLKTNEVIPYSSVFLQLDCKYWSTENEQLLREAMKTQN